MTRLLSLLFIRARYIFKTEGLMTLLSREGAFLISYLVRYFFQYKTFYLYEHTIVGRNEADFLPKIQNITVEIVSTNQQADTLAADGFDFRSYSIYDARKRLDKGAIALCIFVGQELAYVGWVAMTEEAKTAIDALPYHVDFSDDQAWTGGVVTVPKYRGKGLMTYGYYKRLEFLRQRGFRTSRNAVDVSNIASQKVLAKFGPKIYAIGRYFKILWWKSWKEIPPYTK